MSIFHHDDVTFWDKAKTILAYVFVIALSFGAAIWFGFVDG